MSEARQRVIFQNVVEQAAKLIYQIEYGLWANGRFIHHPGVIGHNHLGLRSFSGPIPHSPLYFIPIKM